MGEPYLTTVKREGFLSQENYRHITQWFLPKIKMAGSYTTPAQKLEINLGRFS
jgi:hypothetical protein